jgi:hypothetical protein
MKRKLINLILAIMMLSIGPHAFAQRSGVKLRTTGDAIHYHGGPVMQGATDVYVIAYGDWSSAENDVNAQTLEILLDFLVGLGSSQYAKINTEYPDSLGNRPSGALFYGGTVYEPTYSRGMDLKEEDVQGIITDQVDNGQLPVQAHGVYLVLGAPGVTAGSLGFCQPNSAPHHGYFNLYGTQMKYAFVGNPRQCPAIEGSQFVGRNGALLPTPNGNFAADTMALDIAYALNTTITNPLNTAWYDSLGLENSDKCVGKFGETYMTPNGARANVRLSGRDFLLQQNWVNAAIGYCSLSPEALSGNQQR